MELGDLLMIPTIRRTMERIGENSMVHGYVVVNDLGFPEKSTLDSLSSSKYASHMRTICAHATTATGEIDPTNEVVAVRLVTRKNEILVTPDSEFHIVIVMRTKTAFSRMSE